MTAPKQTSVYLTEHDQALLKKLQERHGLSRSSVIRFALERLDEADAPRNTRLVEIAEELRQMA